MRASERSCETAAVRARALLRTVRVHDALSSLRERSRVDARSASCSRYEPGAAERLLRRRGSDMRESRGNPDLRRAIAALYERTGEDGVLVHGGAQEPIFAFMNVALQPGDHVVAQFPAYQSHYSVAASAGRRGLALGLRSGARRRAGSRRTRRAQSGLRPAPIVITTPNNPTGYVFDRERLDATVAIARKHGLWLFADEVYRGSERDPADRIPAVCDLYERGVSLGGMAKAYGLAGRAHRLDRHPRRGSLRTHGGLQGLSDDLQRCAERVPRAVALRHDDALTGARARDRGTQLWIARRLFRAARASAGNGRGRAPERRRSRATCAGSTQQLCAELVERAGVLLLPSALFDAGDDRVRFGYGRENLPEALARSTFRNSAYCCESPPRSRRRCDGPSSLTAHGAPPAHDSLALGGTVDRLGFP